MNKAKCSTNVEKGTPMRLDETGKLLLPCIVTLGRFVGYAARNIKKGEKIAYCAVENMFDITHVIKKRQVEWQKGKWDTRLANG